MLDWQVGHLIGIEALLHTGGPRLYRCHAITYLHCSSLAQENLQVILDKFPSVKHSFRLLGLRAIFREEVIAYCIAMRTLDLKRIKEERCGSQLHTSGSGSGSRR
jgi:hypothetical protein